jgi:hypothetical protein
MRNYSVGFIAASTLLASAIILLAIFFRGAFFFLSRKKPKLPSRQFTWQLVRAGLCQLIGIMRITQ